MREIAIKLIYDLIPSHGEGVLGLIKAKRSALRTLECLDVTVEIQELKKEINNLSFKDVFKETI